MDNFFGNLGNSHIDSFPRFNVIQVGEDKYSVELALPGWCPEAIKISFENGLLTVEGDKQDCAEKTYIHRGISGKAFKRSFITPKNLEVDNAALKHGLLVINFKPRVVNPPKYIEIKT